jgi:hypothetical protein
MVQENGEVVVRDLGSTNGVRINSQRVESGRLRPGDELSIAHIRYRLDDGRSRQSTIAESPVADHAAPRSEIRPRYSEPPSPVVDPLSTPAFSSSDEDVFAAAVRRLLPSSMADKCEIKVIVKMAPEREATEMVDEPIGVAANLDSENPPECHSDSCL